MIARTLLLGLGNERQAVESNERWNIFKIETGPYLEDVTNLIDSMMNEDSPIARPNIEEVIDTITKCINRLMGSPGIPTEGRS